MKRRRIWMVEFDGSLAMSVAWRKKAQAAQDADTQLRAYDILDPHDIAPFPKTKVVAFAEVKYGDTIVDRASLKELRGLIDAVIGAENDLVGIVSKYQGHIDRPEAEGKVESACNALYEFVDALQKKGSK